MKKQRNQPKKLRKDKNNKKRRGMKLQPKGLTLNLKSTKKSYHKNKNKQFRKQDQSANVKRNNKIN